MTIALSERLRQAAADLPADGLSLQQLAAAHGPAAQGSLLILLAAPCLMPLPGVGSVLGFGLLAMAMTFGVVVRQRMPSCRKESETSAFPGFGPAECCTCWHAFMHIRAA